MTDDELVRALEREATMLTQRGKTLYAADAHRLAKTLRQALKAHKAAIEEVVRSEERTKAGGDGLLVAKAALQARWTVVVETQESARRFLQTPR